MEPVRLFYYYRPLYIRLPSVSPNFFSASRIPDSLQLKGKSYYKPDDDRNSQIVIVF